MPDLNLVLFYFVNGLAGHSWLADSIVAHLLTNDLLKSAPIGACFFAAWYSAQGEAAVLSVRRGLLLTLLATALTITTTTVLSHLLLQPRPYLREHKIYTLQGTALQEVPRIQFRQPLDNRSSERAQAARIGNIPSNDLHAFPSDHAGLFLCLSFGLCCASRGIGLLGLAWTLVVIVGGKVITGMHMPLEIAAGLAIALFWLSVCYALARTKLRSVFPILVSWTQSRPAISAAVLFAVVFEVASTLDHVKAMLSAASKLI